jgi:hypothetical protein
MFTVTGSAEAGDAHQDPGDGIRDRSKFTSFIIIDAKFSLE